MPEPLTTSLVVEILQDLRVNFPQRVKQDLTKLADLYRNGLTGVTGDGLRHAAKRVVQEDHYFPKVARLRELAAAFDAVSRSSTRQAAGNDLYCETCRSHATYQQRWRPMVDKQWKQITRDGYLYLEQYERLLCNCAAPCAYTPIPGLDVACMKLPETSTVP